jgi:uracil-DNA glycosylase
MRMSEIIACERFPCTDVRHEGYRVPTIDIVDPKISLVLISEAAAPDPADDYYAAGEPLFARTTVEAFRDAGAQVSTIQDILDMGVYLTTAVKCAKIGYGLCAATIRECSLLLEGELDQLPNVRAYLLMGDVAIKAVNAMARRAGEGRAIPAGSTYKIRGGEFWFRGARALPSYLQAGPSFYIEKSKRQMIAEDIATALALMA